MDTFRGADEAAVANDDGGRMIGVPVPSAIPTPKARLAFAVLQMPVSAARAGLAGAGRWDWYYVDTSFEGLVDEDLLVLRETDVGERLVEAGLLATALAACGACHVDDALGF